MEKLKLHTPDLTAENIEKLAALFPNCVTETKDEKTGQVKRAIDFDQLRQELSDHIVEGPRERYHLDWPGKRDAILAANAPIAKTLRPCREESVDFDTTKNLFIEGDNLDALKLLQEIYLGKVKLIYIDPPYNTGSDLVYQDSFSVDAESYLKTSNQKDEAGNRLAVNSESNGRFHSDWLKMIYPRLRLARNLLRDDGVILISIDDNELDNARKVCNEVFGESNFIACMVWEKGRKNDAKLISVGHEYILIFGKSVSYLRETKTIWREEKPGAREIWGKYLELRKQHGEENRAIERDLQAWFSSLPKSHPSKKWARYKNVDSNGPWRDDNISWPGGDGPRYDVLHPTTQLPCKVPERGWIFASHEEMQRRIKLGVVEFRKDHTEPPYRKSHIRPIEFELSDVEVEESETTDGDTEELATQVRGSYFYKQSQVSVKYLRKLFGSKVFSNPKDHFELARLIEYVTSHEPDAIVLDFFAGSGSTGHAVFHLNQSDRGNRRFVLVQLPEVIDPARKEQKAAAKFCDSINRPRTIAEITKERLRIAGSKAKNEAEPVLDDSELLFGASASCVGDIGFRVLKIDSSNMNDVYYAPDSVKQDQLALHTDNIKQDRTPEDLLFQVLVDWGVDLALPIELQKLAGKTVFFVDGNALAACFDPNITEDLVKELAKRKPLRAVFRDSSYASDSTKINVAQIFKLLSPETEIKCL
jgi:adenine-specific DNA-methyltransferase